MRVPDSLPVRARNSADHRPLCATAREATVSAVPELNWPPPPDHSDNVPLSMLALHHALLARGFDTGVPAAVQPAKATASNRAAM
jgi:hypothetical protein